MKKIFLILSVIVVVVTSCETDFDVNAEWEETTVLYGLLDASKDTQYIKINKAYLGEGDAMMMAEYSDSINFNPNDLEVKLHKIQFDDTLISIILDTTLIDKEDGLFAVDNNIIYRSITDTIPNFLSDNYRYALTIKNKKSGNKVSANTEVISDAPYFIPSNYALGLYNKNMEDSLKFLSKTVEWDDINNGVIYQLDIIFNYTENNVLKSLVWRQPLVTYTGIKMQTVLQGTKFFNFLRNNLEDDVNVIREFVDLDWIMTVGTEDLDTYIKVNEPLTGIVQQRPQFTNINNGLGIFSSRYTHTEEDVPLTGGTEEYLIDHLDRNFQ